MRKIKKIVYCTGTRADYGLARPVLFELKKKKFKVELLVTGMHLMPEFGHTIDEVRNDGFKIHEIKAVFEDDRKESSSLFVGKCESQMAEKLVKIKPDLVLVLGDRAEMLAATIAASYLGIAVAHMRGGEITSTIDDPVRHAITRLAHIHLCTTPGSAERLRRMGEQDFRIDKVGDPGLDSVIKISRSLDDTKKDKLAKRFLIDRKKPLAIMIQHSVSVEESRAAEQAKETLLALNDLRIEMHLQILVIYPCADAGGRSIIREIERFRSKEGFKIFKNIAHSDFIGIMSLADVIVGNSSSGITETASLKTATVNIGTRQLGREQNPNVIDSGYDRREIRQKIKIALSADFRKRIDGRNIYGDGKAAVRIARRIGLVNIDKRLMQKRLAY